MVIILNYGYQNYNYMNPYGYSNQYSYQGFQNQQMQPITSNQQSQQNQQNVLQGWYVDGLDVTKAINADMSGNAMFFPSTDGKEIYKKQLDINTGKPITSVYKLENSINQVPNEIDFTPIYSHISEIKSEISQQMSEIKDMVLDSITSPTSKKMGGAK